MTAARLLTPPGTGAIAVIELVGPLAWRIARKLFSKPLPEVAPDHRHYYGRLVGDDVIIAVFDEQRVEIHSHGGVSIVELILNVLAAEGCTLQPPAMNLLARATTLRTANILLDQLHGAFRKEMESQLQDLRLERLTRFCRLGRHLLSPWKVVIAGPPNAGKSTLINALLGYERAVVSPVAGTTRDAVGSVTAFDGWPVELTDTAGLRFTHDELEAEGVARARDVIAGADLIIWLHDAAMPGEPGITPTMLVANKCDLPGAVIPAGALPISALNGNGVPTLIAMLIKLLVPVAPIAGEAVPYTPELADAIDAAHLAVTTGNLATARELLESCRSVSARHEAALIDHSPRK